MIFDDLENSFNLQLLVLVFSQIMFQSILEIAKIQSDPIFQYQKVNYWMILFNF